jgi:hypothetical protein
MFTHNVTVKEPKSLSNKGTQILSLINSFIRNDFQLRTEKGKWKKKLVGNFIFGLVISAAALVFFHTTQAQPVVFTDGTFNIADWTASLINPPTNSPTFTSSQNPLDGIPRPSRLTRHNYQTSIRVAHLFRAEYDPALVGPITSIQYSYDLRHYTNIFGLPVEYRLLILQNNTYYTLCATKK